MTTYNVWIAGRFNRTTLVHALGAHKVTRCGLPLMYARRFEYTPRPVTCAECRKVVDREAGVPEERAHA